MITKEIERSGIPVAQVCTIVPIAQTVGTSRIVSAIAIPHPVSDPSLPPQENQKLRRSIVEKALKALTLETDGNLVIEGRD